MRPELLPAGRVPRSAVGVPWAGSGPVWEVRARSTGSGLGARFAADRTTTTI